LKTQTKSLWVKKSAFQNKTAFSFYKGLLMQAFFVEPLNLFRADILLNETT